MKLKLDKTIRQLIRSALREDVGPGDITTRHFLPRSLRLKGSIVAKQSGVLCGLGIGREVFRQVCPKARFIPLARDGQRVRPGQRIARIDGPREILTAERIALNFLQHLSGIATLTRAYADRLRATRAHLYDTRKTLPGWRGLEKYAVRCGRGFNHRMGLYDAAMLKDNHNAWLDPQTLRNKIRDLRRKRARLPIIMEAKNRAQVESALDCGPDVLLLDNMTLSHLKREIRLIRSRSPRTWIEVSGGVSLANIRKIAKLGPDRISVGRITHSAPALDLSLEIEP